MMRADTGGSTLVKTATTRRDAFARLARGAKRRVLFGTPRRLRTAVVAPTAVSLSWKAPKEGAKRIKSYEVLRDGKRIAKTKQTSYTDTKVKPGKSYRYSVRGLDGKKHPGPVAKDLKVTTPQLPQGAGTGAGAGSGAGAGTGTGDVPSDPAPPPPRIPIGAMTQAMVDRLFWRAGFGPTAADRQQWVGQDWGDLVDFFLNTPESLSGGSAPTYNGAPIDPLATDDELVMEWLDRMIRSTNPFVERMTLFWHRHFAISRDAGIDAQWMIDYVARVRRYADFGSNPNASFKDLAYEMTTADAAMSYWLTGFQNVRGHVNENYGREFMELFCLGVRDAQGNDNYTQNDVHQLARAFTGWRLDFNNGTVSFSSGSFDGGQKTIFGQTANFNAATGRDKVLAHPNHAPFLVQKIWSEFIMSPIPPDTMSDLVSTYVAGGGYVLKPLLRKILTDPLIFESLDEPNMTKPPVVFLAGATKATGAPLKDYWQRESLQNMQQLPYHPPNVAGWEGGLSWLNTDTAQARFDYTIRCLYLNGQLADVPAETAQEAYDRAYAAVGSPWLSDQTKALLLQYAQTAPTTTANKRRERQYGLRALMLGGPDGQVM